MRIRSLPAIGVLIILMTLLAGCELYRPHVEMAPPMQVPATYGSDLVDLKINFESKTFVHKPLRKPPPFVPPSNEEISSAFATPAILDTRRDSPPPASRSYPAKRWWEDFSDPDLDKLIRRSLVGNFSLRRAWARLTAARANARLAGAALTPSLDGEMGASRTRTDIFQPSLGRDVATTTKRYKLGLVAAYEVDLWRRVRNSRDAARFEARASREDLNAAAISLSAQVATTWYQLVEERARLRLLREQVKTNETFLQLTRLRFGQGLTSAVDVYQQKERLHGIRREIPLTEAVVKTAEHQLATLLGLAPGNLVIPPLSVLPQLPPLPAKGMPVDLLTSRPDVRARHLRLAAVDYRLAAAVADRLPALRLTGTVQQQAATTGNLFNNWLWNIAGGLTAPLLDGGRRATEVTRQQALRREALLAWGETVLQAIREVEDAAVQEDRERANLTEMDEQLASAKSALRESRLRYINGQTDYLRVLMTLSTFQQLEREHLRVSGTILQLRIALCRALGGSWMATLRPTAMIRLTNFSEIPDDSH